MKKISKSKILILLGLFLIFSINSFSQVLITDDGSTTPDGSAMLEIKSNDKGMLIPRMTTTNREALHNSSTAKPGLLVFDSDLGSFFIYGKTAKGTDGWVDLSNGGTVWEKSGNNVYLANSSYNVGIGTDKPNKKLVIKAENQNDTLFEILDSYGKPLMIITPTLSKFYFNETNAKGIAGGFAVGRYASAKAVSDTALFLVTPDSTRVYTSGDATKGVAGGFAVGRYASAKASPIQYFNTNISSTRVYTDGSAKGVAGGFAVGRYASAKGEETYKYFYTDIDSTRVYTDGSETKGVAGGFAVGRYASAKATKGSYMYMIPDNYFIGDSSGLHFQQNPTLSGRYNTFFGYKTGMINEIGSRNVLLGYEAGINNINGSDNVLLGYQAGHEVTTAGNNISIGSQAGYFNTNNSDNIFLGRQAGYNHTGDGTANDAINNIYIGLKAGYGDEAEGNRGNNNIFIGTESGLKNKFGNSNIFLGYKSGYNNFGQDAGLVYGSQNIFFGEESGYYNIKGYNNVFLGYKSGYNNDDGTSNVFIGNKAGFGNVSGGNNVIMGTEAGDSARYVGASVIIGQSAGHKSGKTTNEWHNVYIGYMTGRDNDDGSSNTYIGSMAGMESNSRENIFVGMSAGRQAGGRNSTYVGNSAGYTASGENNVFLGYLAGQSYTDGGNNVFIGSYAGRYGSTGRNNTFIGHGAGELNDGEAPGNGNVLIGYQAGSEEDGISNKLFIDNSNTSEPLIWGDFSINEIQVNGDLTFNAGTNSVKLPTDRGSDGQVLVTDGAGNSSWSGGTPVAYGRVTRGWSSLTGWYTSSSGSDNFSVTWNDTEDRFEITVTGETITTTDYTITANHIYKDLRHVSIDAVSGDLHLYLWNGDGTSRNNGTASFVIYKN